MTIAIKFLTQFDGKGLAKAEKGLTKFNKTAVKLAGSLGIALGTTAIARYAKASAKAFMLDEAAASKLSQSIKNLGLAYATDDIRKYIDNLTLATGVADSELRPALQALLQVTGSVTKSQALLSDAINISRGSGENLSTVANDLSQAYVGNLKGLRKYNLGLTQAELKASSFADIQERLNSLFSGSSAAYLATYAGQMQILKNTADEAQEIIGKGLVDALAAISDSKGVEDLATGMLNLATYTSNVITGIGTLIDKLDNSRIVKLLGGLDINMIPIVGGLISNLERIGSSAIAAKDAFNFKSGGGAGTGSSKSIADAQAAKAEAAAKKRQAELLALQKKQIKATKEQTALKKGSALFDLEQIGIAAALKLSIDKETRLRLQLLQAIQLGDADKVLAKMKELADYQKNSDIARLSQIAAISAAQAAADKQKQDALDKYLKSLSLAGNPLGYYPVGKPYDPRDGNMPDAPPALSNMPSNEPIDYGYTAANPSFTYTQPSDTIVNFNAPITTTSTEEFARLVQKAIQNNNRFGNNLDYAGAI